MSAAPAGIAAESGPATASPAGTVPETAPPEAGPKPGPGSGASAALLPTALVVPVRDDAAGLARLLDQALGAGLFAEIVVVDDGSDPPAAVPGGVRRILGEGRGGGAARNRGLAEVTAPYVLFFDADDLLMPQALGALLADLAEAGPFDLCLMKHADSRVLAAGGAGQPGWDERFWAEAGLGHRALAEAARPARPLLAQTANYPWNKVFRTAFLREAGIGCAETAVHQDLPLHWRALMAAERMLVSDRIGAVHEVGRGAGRVTNRSGAERLQLFEVLGPVAAEVATLGGGEGGAWRAALAAFALGLCDWARARIAADLRDRFGAAEGAFFGSLAGWDLADPALARAVAGRAGGAR